MRGPRLRPVCLTIASFLVLLMGGCDWLSKPAGDPRRESNYQDGLRWVDQARWDDARESFYHSLEANPQNLYANLALGDLYRTHLTNQVLALFHYTRYLEIGTLQNRGEFHDQSASDGIRNAEIELARRFAEKMFRDQQQNELDNLRRTNVVLLERIDVLNRQVALLTPRLFTPSNPPPSNPNPPRIPPPPGNAGLISTGRLDRPAPVPPAGSKPSPAIPALNPIPPRRTHRVQAGENLGLIARHYGVKLAALQAANPNVNPHKLKVDQYINLPAH